MSRRGHDRERAVKALLEADDWIVIRAPGSLGIFDLAAMKRKETNRLIEVKSTVAGPYHSFGPEDRRALLEAAEKAGAVAELAWWPPRGQLQFIPSAEWP